MPKTEGTMEFVAIGNLQKAVWQVQDLCLFGTVTAGMGVHQYSDEMLTYIKDYLTAIKSKRSLYAGTVVEDLQVDMIPSQWGGKTYWSVDITLTISEIL